MPIPCVALRVNKIPKGSNISVEIQPPNKVVIALSSDKFLSSHRTLMAIDESTTIKTPTARRTKNIIKIGQNMPLMKATINAGGGDSVINTLQLLGRNKRTHESKKRGYYFDFMDQGSYLKRHSKHRRNVFIQEKHKVIDAFNK